MIRKLWLKICIVIGIFGAFTTLYKLLERSEVYNRTLAKFTLNYVKVDTNGHSVIEERNAPYSRFIEKSAYNWDVKFYKSIRDSLYEGTGVNIIYRYAFYPLFPLVWRLSHTNVHGIVLINFLFFGLSIILLSSIFIQNVKSEIFLFTLALLLPTSIVYYLPYTESLFLLSFSIALVGLLKKKYWLFFLAMVCLSMTRPAALLLCVVFIVANVVNLISHKKFTQFLKECFFTLFPILTGVVLVILLQYIYSNSWTSYLHACNLWPKEPDLYERLVDWSTEGFGMNTFAIFALAIPAILYIIVWGNSTLLGKEKGNTAYLFSGDREYIKKYMFNVSMLFIAGFTLFNILASGYQLNGFFRYTMATPFFFIVFFQLPEKLKSVPIQYKASGFVALLLGILLFLLSTEYAGDIIRFKYLGLYLLIPIVLLVLLEPYLSNKLKLIALIILILPCLIWQTYLFNMYLGDTWIFT